jgi:hypothetical protein
MLRMAVRFGVVRFFGRRAVPAMLAVDLLLLANRTRQVPIVDRNLRRGVAAAGNASTRSTRARLGRSTVAGRTGGAVGDAPTADRPRPSPVLESAA